MEIKRREFIKGCAAASGVLAMSGGAGAALAGSATAEQASSGASIVASALTPIGGYSKPATQVIAGINAAMLEQLPFTRDTQDYADALVGLVTPLPPDYAVMPNPYSTPEKPLPPIWDLSAYDFLKEGAAPPDAHTVWVPAPPEANPSLWRQAQLNLVNGLFEIAPHQTKPDQRIYQVRGQDMTNLTIVETDEGVILIDPCQCNESAAAAFALYRAERDPNELRPIKAVIYTHSHADHYGGVHGVISDEYMQTHRVRIIAPENFLDKVISENVLAGTAMSRRSQYSYGLFLPRSTRGQIDAGLGKAIAMGTGSLIAPTESITYTGQTLDIDGVEIKFQLTPDAEAPAEMMFYFPQFRVLDGAEVACSLIHNIYTLRGAELRDATKWSFYLNEAIDMWGAESDVVILSHNWPTWGAANVIKYLEIQRDLYKYLHDQTLNLANRGLTMLEIAEQLTRERKLPAGLDQQWFCRGYYGSVSVNVKAVYNKYLGYYDCNPAHIEPLPPVEAAKRYVDMMGGPEAIVARAKKTFDKATSIDDYRWVAELMSHVVFADPANTRARYLAADALEQLGYQAESAIWRNHYLTGAWELRNGNKSQNKSSVNGDMFKAMKIGSYFDYLGVRLNGAKAEGKTIVLNWVIRGMPEDEPVNYTMNLSNAALTYRANRHAANPDATVELNRGVLDAINTAPNEAFPDLNSEQAFDDAMARGQVQVAGDRGKVHELLGAGPDGMGLLLDQFATTFNIIEP